MGIVRNGRRYGTAFYAKALERCHTDLSGLAVTFHHTDLIVYFIRDKISVFCRHFFHQMRRHDLMRIHLYHIGLSVACKLNPLSGKLPDMNRVKQFLRHWNPVIFLIVFLSQDPAVLHHIGRTHLLQIIEEHNVGVISGSDGTVSLEPVKHCRLIASHLVCLCHRNPKCNRLADTGADMSFLADFLDMLIVGAECALVERHIGI